MTIKWIMTMVLLAGFHQPIVAEEDLAYARAVEVLQQQVQSANSSRARLEIQMRLLSPEEQRQVEELGELEHQLSRTLDQLEKGKVAGTMNFQGGFIEVTRLGSRRWKRELARIEGITEPGPAWQLRQVGELINSRRFFLEWLVDEREVLKPLRRMVIEQVNARLLVAIKLTLGVKRSQPKGELPLPSPC
tara:strand:- start:1093 stop:1662 length:570 start_codon:yes stop_codon:yes gene_type:complete